ncbi:alpha/beta-hydrolase [Guyanagaster necrorhizus]|uniref:Alpha/beta-hydrolase n=1 Tax=Guyanagaster necrorhizus TaxID=856835 RepID=A0A9P7VP39_9AGAR|nr:alpha/beta-hydrolase [Guyanagaster necrorhizus MCA 3950]KAG7443895.1 alpha/beta-hydrolase [Guyanagaster necrorhizus MCA 3950]
MLTSTLIFVFLFQSFLVIRTAPVPFDFGGLLDDVFGGEDDDTSGGGALSSVFSGDDEDSNDSGLGRIVDDLLSGGDNPAEDNGGLLDDALDASLSSDDTDSGSIQNSNNASNDEDAHGVLDGLVGKTEDAISDGASDLLRGILGDDDSASTTASSTISVSSAELTTVFSRPAFFSRMVYCSSASVTNFSCGAPCEALNAESVEILATGGDGGTVPRFVIAHDKSTNSVVVAHQGTDPENMRVLLAYALLSILNDAEFVPTPIDTEFFPSAAGKNIAVHSGFQETFSRTASTVLSTVQSAVASTGAETIVLTGHSLGAALATLDALMFNDALTNVSIQTTTFGSPRVGNQAFADLVDASLSSGGGGGGGVARITNRADPVPHLPPLVLDFVHAQGEVHLGDAGAALCEGQENDSDACADGVGLLAIADGVGDHIGPYFDGISFGQQECSA